MVAILLTKKIFPDKYWLKYTNADGIVKHVDLSGCANNFSRATGYESQDGLRAVGWQFIEDGQICMELFNIGHTLLVVPLRPSLTQTLGYLLSGKNPQRGHREFLDRFAQALAAGGWKIVNKDEVMG